MVDRRTTLLGMISACGAGLVHAATDSVLTAKGDTPTSSPSDRIRPSDASIRPTDAGATAMQEDLARLGSHEYSDEGIPVFLACLDLVAEGAGQPTPQGTRFSKHIGAEIKRYGNAWLRMHPDAPVTDASKVIEVLAERDFALAPKGANN